jgi:hypothetical protein
MFNFKNPNTPIIASGTVVDHGGVKFTINAGVLQYFYSVTTDDGRDLGLVPMGGRGFNWKAGIDAVKAVIKEASNA